MRPVPGRARQTRRPAERAGGPSPCLVLHRAGFVMPWTLPTKRWALTPPFHPYRVLSCENSRRFIFCDTFHRARSAQSVSASRAPSSSAVSHGALPYGVRTFLSQTHRRGPGSKTPGDPTSDTIPSKHIRQRLPAPAPKATYQLYPRMQRRFGIDLLNGKILLQF